MSGLSAGELLVEITPDTSRFGYELGQQAEQAARGVDVGVDVAPDTTNLLSRLRSSMQSITGRADVGVDVEPDVTGLAGELNRSAELATAGTAINMDVDPSTVGLAAETNAAAELATAGVAIDVPIHAHAGPQLAAQVAAQTTAAGAQAGGAAALSGQAAGKRMGAGMGATLLKVGGPLAAAAGVVAGGKFAVSAFKNAEVQASANARLSTVFKSMGFKQNADEALEYANSLETVIGVERETIKDAQTKLATFKTLAKDQDTMARATLLAADLSAAGFGDMGTQAQGLGKALQDPANGLALLTKQGAITKAEQKAIKTELEATGDVAKAQGQIFEVLEKQVGGVAEATADTSAKMSLKWRQIGLTIGKSVTPFMERLLPVVEDFVDGTIAALPKIGAAFRTVIDFVSPVIDAVRSLFNGGGEAGQGDGFGARIGAIISAVQGLWDTLQPILADVSAAMSEAWDTIGPAVSDAFNSAKAIVEGVMAIIADIIGKVTGAIRIIWEKWGDGITEFVTTAFETVAGIVRGAMQVIQGVIDTVLAVLKGDWGAAWDGLLKIVDGIWDLIFEAVTGGIDAVAGIIDGLWALFKTAGVNIVKGLWAGIGSVASWLGDKFSGFFEGLPGIVKRIFGISSPSKVMAGFGVNIIQGMVDGIAGKSAELDKAFTGLVPTEPLPVPPIDWRNAQGPALELVGGTAALTGAAGAARVAGDTQREVVEQHNTFNNYYPKPERATDSAAMQMRRANAQLGVA